MTSIKNGEIMIIVAQVFTIMQDTLTVKIKIRKLLFDNLKFLVQSKTGQGQFKEKNVRYILRFLCHFIYPFPF